MSKLEELRFAFEAATAGEWSSSKHATPDYAPQYGIHAEGGNDLAIVRGTSNADFICAAHAMMPLLLEAVDLLAWITEFCAEHDEWFGGSDPATGSEAEWMCNALKFMEKLK